MCLRAVTDHTDERRHHDIGLQRPAAGKAAEHVNFRGMDTDLFVGFAQRGRDQIPIGVVEPSTGKGHLPGMGLHAIVAADVKECRFAAADHQRQQHRSGLMLARRRRHRVGGRKAPTDQLELITELIRGWNV
jgi:hypothetical protein